MQLKFIAGIFALLYAMFSIVETIFVFRSDSLEPDPHHIITTIHSISGVFLILCLLKTLKDDYHVTSIAKFAMFYVVSILMFNFVMNFFPLKSFDPKDILGNITFLLIFVAVIIGGFANILFGVKLSQIRSKHNLVKWYGVAKVATGLCMLTCIFIIFLPLTETLACVLLGFFFLYDGKLIESEGQANLS